MGENDQNAPVIAAQPTIVTLPSYPPFDCTGEGVGVRWTRWVNRLKNNIFVAYHITEDVRKKAILLTIAGDDLNDIVENMPEASLTPGVGENVFDKMVSALDTYFNPRQNTEFQRYLFRNAKQLSDENMDKYHGRLSKLADTCNFQDKTSEIKSQIILGASCDKVTRKGLGDADITLTQLIEYAKTLEITSSQQKEIKNGAAGATSVNAVKHDNRHKQKKHTKQSHSKRVSQHRRASTCHNCGGSWPHRGGQRNCPARNHECWKCHKLHHFPDMCKSSAERPETAHQSERQPQRNSQHNSQRNPNSRS